MSGMTRSPGRVRLADVVVVLVVIAAFAVGAHFLGFGPFADSRSPVDRVESTVDVDEPIEDIPRRSPSRWPYRPWGCAPTSTPRPVR